MVNTELAGRGLLIALSETLKLNDVGITVGAVVATGAELQILSVHPLLSTTPWPP